MAFVSPLISPIEPAAPLLSDQELDHNLEAARDPSVSEPSTVVPTESTSDNHEDKTNSLRNRHDSDSDYTTSPLRSRLGTYAIWMNILSVAGLFLSTGTITWIWFGDPQNGALGDFIMLDMLGQTVTLCSVFVRLAVGVQATTIVSFLASVALERQTLGGVKLVNAPGFSIARYSNGGPIGALSLFWSGLARRGSWLLALLFVTALTSTASQFTSTLLLWDVERSSIVERPLSYSGKAGFRYDSWLDNNMASLAYQGRNYWTGQVASIPAFAEWSKPPEVQSEHIVDTGPSLRAFLPIGSPDLRSRMLSYSGPGAVFDTRVVCSRPRLKFNKLTRDKYAVLMSAAGTFEHGLVTEEVKKILRLPAQGNNEFNISFMDMAGSSLHFLQVNHVAGGLINSLDPTANQTLNITAPRGHRWEAGNFDGVGDSAWQVDLGHSFLLVHAPDFQHQGTQAPTVEYVTDGGSLLTSDNGVWIELHEGKGPRTRITMCYDALYSTETLYSIRVKHHQDFPISAARDQASSDPTTMWNNETSSFDTMDLSRELLRNSSHEPQMYALNREGIDDHLQELRGSWDPKVEVLIQPPSKRGSLNQEKWRPLGSREELSRIPIKTKDWAVEDQAGFRRRESVDFVGALMWQPFFRAVNDRRFNLRAICQDCTQNLLNGGLSRDTTPISPTLSSIAWDVFEASGHDPAKTWQALTTAVMSSAYYDLAPVFSDNQTMTTTQIGMYLRPTRYRGYAIAMSIAAAHLVVFILALVLFSITTTLSSIENSWQVVAQLIAPETYPVLAKSTTRSDSEISAMLDTEFGGDDDAACSGSQQLWAKKRVVLQRYKGGTVGVVAV
ncbi:hypothetical protein MN608_11201 [Microdochium nivale]|nr:hypothetical protein MN608_11201 [Microdochium nivale]